MTSDICADDVVVRIATPQIISSEAVGGAGGVGGGAGVPGGGARVAAAVELGRRLLLAARAGDTPQVLDLMAKGAPFTTDWLGTSPLHLAASNAHVDTCAVLLRAGVSRDARTKVDRTPLHLAACGGHASVARLLLEAGAAVDCRDMLRMTPLHWAAQRGHGAVAAELLRAGAEPRATSKFHKTPVSLAAELGRHDLLKLMEDTIKEREAKKSVDALVNEEMAETTSDSKVQIFETVQRIKDIIPTTKSKQLPNERVIKIEHKTQPTRTIKIDHKTESGESESSRVAAQLLKKHGITLLPTDDGSTVLNALQSGRTVVLSDAGKLMLKESVTESPPSANKSPTNKGVVLTATPVTTSPRARVKVFALNNKMLALNKDGSGRLPVKKIINPQDMQHLKFVQLPPEAKILSPSKLLPMKAKNRLVPRRTIVNTGTRPVMSTSNAGTRPAVKIIMNKSNFNKLMANAVRADQPDTEVSVADDAVDMSDEPTSEPALRAQLLAAQQQVAALRRELRAAQAKLAQYEPQM